MESFRWIAVAISMVLGIGVTRLLSAGVTLIRNRDAFKLDVLPIAWAVFIFFAQVQFWWAIIELAKLMKVWTITTFVTLLAMPLLLFVAAALILPSEPRERDLVLRNVFERDGRLALLALAAYNAIACIADARWWSSSIASLEGVGLIALAALPIWLFFTSRRGAQLAITGAYGLVLLISAIADSPGSYG